MRRRVPDVTKLRRLTGFVPATPLATTIDQIIAAIRAESVAAEGVAGSAAESGPEPSTGR